MTAHDAQPLKPCEDQTALSGLSAREESERRVAETLRRRLGPVGCRVLAEPGVFELMLNPDGSLWEDRHGAGMTRIGEMSPHAAESFIGSVAATLRGTVTRENPIIECVLPMDAPFRGARFEAMIPPVVSAPTFAIRTKAAKVFTLDEYVSQGVMTAVQRDLIRQAVMARDNVLVVGGTGSGKTTLLNAILHETAEVHPSHRLVLIEDAAELQCPAPNVVPMLVTDGVSMRRLLKASMRLRPDRIIIGETRGGEALDMLKAWNTGHDGGASTIHANDAAAALIRIEQLIGEVSQSPMQALIAEAIDLIVFIAKTPEGRKVKEVLAVHGYQNGAYQLSNKEISWIHPIAAE